MNHQELQDLLPAYALDALGPSEEMEVRAHLASCATCREMLAPLVETAGSLALLAPPSAPSPALRGRILAEAARPDQQVEPPKPAPLRRRAVWRRAAAGLAAAAVLVSAVFTMRLAGRLNDQERQLDEQRRLVEILASGSSSTPLMAAGPGSEASGQIFVAADSRSAGIVVAGLADPGDDIYQVWLLEDGSPVPLDAFRPDRRGVAVLFVEANLENMDGMAVTLEDESGLPAPQGPAVLRSA